ncbi:MAG: Fur family transcriptional regulator [Actinoallomurus sp.]
MGSHTATAGRRPRGGIGDEIAVRLRAAGLSPTRRRRQVLEALEGRRRPAGAHELYVELAGQGHSVGMSTVYRTLSALADAGLLHVFVRDGESRYRPCAPGRHYHLVCRRCGDVNEHLASDDGIWLRPHYRRGRLRARPAPGRGVRRVRPVPANHRRWPGGLIRSKTLNAQTRSAGARL